MLNRLSLRANLAVSVITMGFLGVVLAIFIAETYRDYAIDSQRTAFEQIVGLRVDYLLDELARVSHNLGQALQGEQGFRKIFHERDTEALEQHLQSQFHQYFVTAGVIKLESLAVYDDKFSVVAQAFSGTAPLDAGCPNLYLRAANRKGPLRLKTITELCLINGKPHFSMLLPIGGLRITGYLEVITNPMYALQEVGGSLGLPLRMHFIDGLKTYESRDWPITSIEQKGVMATYQPLTEAGEPAFTLSVVRDVSTFESQLTTARNTYVALVSFIALLLAFLMIYLLNKTALQPLQRLGDQLRKIRQDKKQLGTPVTVSGNAEVRELASGFNEMTNELKDLYDTLLTRNEDLSQEINVREAAEHELKKHRDQLEYLVEQRTLDLAKARDAALEASRSKSLFLANMSHELRTPLNAIIGYSEMMIEDMEGSGDTRNATDLKKVHSAGLHLLSLINDILDLTKIEAGKMDLYEEWFDVNSMVQSIADTVQPLLAQNRNHLEVKCPEGLGSLFADITKIRQTLFNLLSNASKFTSEGEIQLSVWQEPAGDQEYICFRVKDEGIGISQEQQDKLFEAFSQADASTTRKFGGTGLGLVISQHFCHMMGGNIDMESEFGKGAAFTVKLPIKKPHAGVSDETVVSWQSGVAATGDRFSVAHAEDYRKR